jgi:hypothetical protein
VTAGAPVAPAQLDEPAPIPAPAAETPEPSAPAAVAAPAPRHLPPDEQAELAALDAEIAEVEARIAQDEEALMVLISETDEAPRSRARRRPALPRHRPAPAEAAGRPRAAARAPRADPARRLPPVSPGPPARPIAVLAGGVGAARFLAGLVRAVPPESVTAIVNTGDDRVFYGVHVSPDLDIVTYTLAGRVDPEKGYGLAGDTFSVIEALGALGHETWFRLGDRDLATALHRTGRLRGRRARRDADEVRRAFRVPVRILPMSEDPCPTYVGLRGGRCVHFEEYLARDGAPDEVEAWTSARPARRARRPACSTLRGAARILVCPSNPGGVDRADPGGARRARGDRGVAARRWWRSRRSSAARR